MIPASPLGASLSCPPPDFTPEQAARAALLHFGLTGVLVPLTSERDVNYLLRAAQGAYVLKLANPAEDVQVTRFQTEALLHLEGSGLPVPRVIRSLTGATEVVLPQGIFRVLTYLEGEMMHRAAPSAALRAEMGRMTARLALGLAGFDHPGADHVLQWDIQRASALRPLLPDLPMDLRKAGQLVLRRFDDQVAPALPALRAQVLHNDLNPHNSLVSEDHARVTGILDFGDMVRTPLVCDLAVAASYLVEDSDPMTSLIQFCAAYHATLPLTGAEAELVISLTEARWLTTLCIAHHRAARYPDNAAYILRNVPRARAGLLVFAGLDRRRTQDQLLKELRLT